MISTIKDYLWRHKRKIFVTTFAMCGSILAFKYIKRKFIQYQQNQTQEFIDRAKHMQHFEATERTCNETVVGLATAMCKELESHLNSDTILMQLRNNPENKLALWEELKVLAFTRLATLVYASSMLVVSVRIQMNILGGYLYRDSKMSESKITVEIQQKYLGLNQFFLKNGLNLLTDLIASKVDQILHAYNLKQKVSLGEIEQIFWSIQMAVNSDAKGPNNSMATYMLPKNVNNYDKLLMQMFTETLDMYESDEISSLCTNNVSSGFSTFMDSVAELFNVNEHNFHAKSSTISSRKEQLNINNGDCFNIQKASLPLAKILPIINELASKEFVAGDQLPCSGSTSLITEYLMSDKMKLLGANVYEVFSQ